MGTESVFAVCAYLTILADNTARATSVTFLPLNNNWLNFALICIDPKDSEQRAASAGMSKAQVRE